MGPDRGIPHNQRGRANPASSRHKRPLGDTAYQTKNELFQQPNTAKAGTNPADAGRISRPSKKTHGRTVCRGPEAKSTAFFGLKSRLRRAGRWHARNRAPSPIAHSPAFRKSNPRRNRSTQNNAPNCCASLRGRRPAGGGPMRGLTQRGASAPFANPLTRKSHPRGVRQESCQPADFCKELFELYERINQPDNGCFFRPLSV